MHDVIAVFGATGRTGRPLVKKALAAGYTVRALVRNPSKLGFSDPKLHLIQGDALDSQKVKETIAGTSGVISLLGPDKNSPPDFLTRATRHIVQAMKREGIRRLMTLTGGGVRDEGRDKPGFVDNLIVFIMKNLAGKGPRNALFDGIEHAKEVKASGLDWTIVRGPVLTEDPARGSYQIGNVGTVKGIKLTREDLADFMLKEFAEKKHLGQMPFLTNG